MSNKPDSCDICFIPDGSTQSFLRACLGFVPGDVVTPKGELVGRHNGYWNFTVGQHKGLRPKNPAAGGHPRYVVEICPDTNQMIVGAVELLSIEHIEANDVVWLAEDGTAEEYRNLFVRVCAHRVSAAVSGFAYKDRGAARVMGVEGGVLVGLVEPIQGVAARQSLMVYRDSRVLGEGMILHASWG